MPRNDIKSVTNGLRLTLQFKDGERKNGIIKSNVFFSKAVIFVAESNNDNGTPVT